MTREYPYNRFRTVFIERWAPWVDSLAWLSLSGITLLQCAHGRWLLGLSSACGAALWYFAAPNWRRESQLFKYGKVVLDDDVLSIYETTGEATAVFALERIETVTMAECGHGDRGVRWSPFWFDVWGEG